MNERTLIAADELSPEVLAVALEIDRIEPIARAALLAALRVELLRMRIHGRTTDKTGGHHAH